ncbi:hypothetical protein [Kribbella italica]|uniref:Zn-dependent protease with chaperone function n=1 Tax=Kribbella italica TaxID=1540520 RepID=A0A7W9J2L2_9ACTN|nr:hypothetical protein [Kribbella italica]MBB5833892.1 hypothetical protein [Kribbella italica]
MSGVEGGSDRPDGPTGGDPRRPTDGQGDGTPQLPIRGPRQPEPMGVQRPGGGGLLLSEIVNGAVWALASFFIIYWFCQLFGADDATWILIAIWLVSGAIVFWRGMDFLLSRFLFGLRQPTMVEGQRLMPSWHTVATRSGLDMNTYSLWIQNADGATAGVGAGNTVTVTGWAIFTLPPSHLEAVLAFDLATHLHGRTWLSRLALWYSVPARLVALGVRQLLKLSRTIPAIGCTIVGFLLMAYIGILLFALVFYDSLAVPLLYLSPVLLPFLFGGLAHWNQRMADRAVVDMGHGRKLLEVLYGWQGQHQEASRRMAMTQPDWLAGQPSVSERIRALENYIQRS